MKGRSRTEVVVWAAVAVVAAVLLAPLFHLVYPLFPESWTLHKREAQAVGLERLRVLGEMPENPYVVTRQSVRPEMESRLRRSQGEYEGVEDSPLAGWVMGWEVRVYKPGARTNEWDYQARMTPGGQVFELRRHVPLDRAAAPLDLAEARQRADRVLEGAGFDLARFEEPDVRRRELESRVDLQLRYRDREAVLGEEIPYGVEVSFAGDRLTGFQPWIEDPEEDALEESFQVIGLLSQLRVLAPYLVFPFVAVYFIRRYHAGEIGVDRSLRIFFLALGAGAVLLLLSSTSAAEGNSFGPLSRRQMTWAWGLQLLILWFSTLSLVAALSWSVGEARCREGWGHKLAAFDALFQRKLDNVTVARSSLRGLAAGLALAAGVLGLVAVLARFDLVEPLATLHSGPWYESGYWPGVGLLSFAVTYSLVTELFGRLFLIPPLTRRLGYWLGGALAVVISVVIFFPPVILLPGGADMLPSALMAAFLVFLFLRFDLWTTLLASFTGSVTLGALPMLLTQDPFLQLQGCLPLVVAALPLVLSVRHLFSDRELVYRYEDVPPHVRRIAERERQRVELETARGIQSSILPDLPPQLAGVELAHAYRPATEVGGDFYDVLALEDGRLALAVGDVAGHGVSSGLVMSMAKSALAVQVTFDPEVEAVFRTLNRTVYQTARRRLLTTLCYALLDPERRELLYASAGHLFPYRIDSAGRVHPLESIAYPLGVRDRLDVVVRKERLETGDALFMMSDGVVEAHAEHDDEPFGFDRLEESLRRWAGSTPRQICEGVLADVERFTGQVPREDDQTVLVARI